MREVATHGRPARDGEYGTHERHDPYLAGEAVAWPQTLTDRDGLFVPQQLGTRTAYFRHMWPKALG